jgi:hypothetical protein
MSTEVNLKWGKKSYMVAIPTGMSTEDFKAQVQSLTGLPPHRQKLLCPKIWKGPLKDSSNVSSLLEACEQLPKNLAVTLIGSTEILEDKSIDDRPKFMEDMTPDEIKQMELSQYQEDEDETDIVDIVALQKEPGLERHDGKVGMYQYNRFVTGLPQHQINSILVKRKNATNEDESQLNDMLAMTMGMELRSAYINSLAVLDNGTIVTGIDDGHVQMWSRCQMIRDLRHASSCVDHVLKCPSSASDGPSFITAGGGVINIWTEEGQRLMNLGAFQGTTPASIATGFVEGHGSMKYLSACFRITRQVDPNQFRLVPQNEHERRRRAEAEARELFIQNELLKASRSVKVWFYSSSQQSNGNLQEITIENDAPVVQLEDMNGNLICGDERGCITRFNWTADETTETTISAQTKSMLQIKGSQCISIALLKRIRENILAVSIGPSQVEHHEEIPVYSPATTETLNVLISRGTLLIDIDTKTVRTVLNAHSDVVHCICPLPDGSILTAGGKMCAKVLLWDNNDISNAVQSEETVVLAGAKRMKEPGYVFDLQVLRDSDAVSTVYAIVGARYNVIKVVV